jgi:hypothetical protein
MSAEVISLAEWSDEIAAEAARVRWRQLSEVIAVVLDRLAARSGDDPLLSLWQRRAAIDATLAEADDPDDVLFHEHLEIEGQIAKTVATSRAGLVVQLSFLAEFNHGFEWDRLCDQLVETMIAGFSRLDGAP